MLLEDGEFAFGDVVAQVWDEDGGGARGERVFFHDGDGGEPARGGGDAGGEFAAGGGEEAGAVEGELDVGAHAAELGKS